MPDYDLHHYYTEAMTVPFYAVGETQAMSVIENAWEMKPTHFLKPMTAVLAQPKPKPNPAYVVAKIFDGPFAGKMGMIWSSHLRQARHKGDTGVGNQTLTGFSYGATSDQLESQIPGTLSPLQSSVKKNGQGNCQKCGSPVRTHKIYESTQARDLLRKVCAAEKYPGQTMVGILLVVNGSGQLECVIGGESGWSGEGFRNGFFTTVESKYHRIWANEELGLMKNVKPEVSTAKLYNWTGTALDMKDSKDAMQCAGPKLIQAYLKWDMGSRNKRATDTLYMSEIWGKVEGQTKQKGDTSYTYDEANKDLGEKKKLDTAFYGGRDSASSCMRCRQEIPWMLCGKAPALEKSDLPALVGKASHA